MAKYKKVKRYHRSFYSPGMWAKKVVGIVVLVAVVLVVGWLAAPHVLDWATHTWYTVVRNRDLSASSGPAASSVAASSEAAAESAASSEVQPASSEPAAAPANGFAGQRKAQFFFRPLDHAQRFGVRKPHGLCRRPQ